MVDEAADDIDFVVVQRIDRVGRFRGQVDQFLLLEQIEVALAFELDLKRTETPSVDQWTHLVMCQA